MASDPEPYHVTFEADELVRFTRRLPNGECIMITGNCPRCGSARIPSPDGRGKYRCVSCGLIRTGDNQFDLEFAENKPDSVQRPEPLETADPEPFVTLKPDPLETR